MNTPRLPPKPTHAERTAAAGVVAVVAGLILPHAALHSLDRAIFVWLMFSVLVGLLLGAKTKIQTRAAVHQALLPSALLPITYAGFWLLRFLADWSKTGFVPRYGLGLSGVSLDLSSPAVLGVAFVILLILFCATLLVMSLSSIGTRPIVLSLVRANRLGPEGFDRMKRIVVSISGLAAALAALWLAAG
jgi:hypothetical protein